MTSSSVNNSETEVGSRLKVIGDKTGILDITKSLRTTNALLTDLIDDFADILDVLGDVLFEIMSNGYVVDSLIST